MAPQIKTVMIIGAGGNLGQAVLPQFLKSSLQVSVLTRPESKSTFPSEVNVVKSSYEPAELQSAFKGQDAVISLLGTFGIADQKKIIDAAVVAGVKWFIPSEFGSDSRDSKLLEYVKPIFQDKVAEAEYLRSKEDKMSWTAVLTGVFFDFGMKASFLGFDLKSHSAEIWGTGKPKWTATNMPTIGKALVNLLESPEKLEAAKNRKVAISSYTISQDEVLSALEKVTGEKWTVTHVDAGQRGKEGQEMLARGEFGLPAFGGVIRGVTFGSAARGDLSQNGKLDNDLLLPGNNENLEEQLKSLTAAVK